MSFFIRSAGLTAQSCSTYPIPIPASSYCSTQYSFKSSSSSSLPSLPSKILAPKIAQSQLTKSSDSQVVLPTSFLYRVSDWLLSPGAGLASFLFGLFTRSLAR